MLLGVSELLQVVECSTRLEAFDVVAERGREMDRDYRSRFENWTCRLFFADPR